MCEYAANILLTNPRFRMADFRAYYITLSSTLQAVPVPICTLGARASRRPGSAGVPPTWEGGRLAALGARASRRPGREGETPSPPGSAGVSPSPPGSAGVSPAIVVKHRRAGLSLAALRPGSSLDARFTIEIDCYIHADLDHIDNTLGLRSEGHMWLSSGSTRL